MNRAAPLPQNRPGPFSRPLAVDEVSDEGLDVAIEATREERAAVAADIGVLAIDALSARFRIDRRAGGRLAVTGALSAGLTQTCVVSLEPFRSTIDQDIALAYAPAVDPAERAPRRRQKGRNEERAAPVASAPPPGEEMRDPPDPIIAGKIDLGAAATEFLVLALDPYPRRPGAHFTDVSIGDADDPDPSPFAALERLKERR